MAVEAGSFAYGLNIVLSGVLDYLTNNSKRVERDFRLTSIQCALSRQSVYDNGFSIILGTEYQDWFNDYIICANIFGDGSLPHFLPGDGVIIPKGSFIIVKARNNDTTEKHLAFLFQGEHL